MLTTPHPGAADFDAEQPFRIERTREPVLLPNPVLTPPRPPAGRRGRRRGGRARSGLAARAHRSDAGPALRGRAARRRGHGARPAAGDPSAAGPGRFGRLAADRGRRLSRSRGPPGDRRPGVGPGRWPRSRPGSTPPGSCRCPPSSGPATRARLGLAADRPVGGQREPAGPPQGHGHPHRRRLGPASATSPGSRVAIAGDGRDRRRLEHRIRKTGRPGPPARPGRRRRPAGVCTPAPTSSPWLPVPVGRPWSRRDSGSSSSRRRRPASPRWRATAAARPRRWSTARPASSCATGRRRRGGGGPCDAADRSALASRQGQAARRRAVEEFGYDGLAARLGEALEKIAATVERVAEAAIADYGARGGRIRQGRSSVEEQVTERMIIRGTPEHCFDVLTAFEALPRVGGRHQGGLDRRARRARVGPLRVTFRAAAFGRSTSYTLRYDYQRRARGAVAGSRSRATSPAASTVRTSWWRPVRGTPRSPTTWWSSSKCRSPASSSAGPRVGSWGRRCGS